MKTCTTYALYVIIHHNDHCKNHIDVVFPYTHTHTVLVHDNLKCKLLYNTDTHSDTIDTPLISAHILRRELQVSMGSAAGGLVRGAAVPRFKKKVFQYDLPPKILAAFVVKFLTFRGERMRIESNKKFKFSLNLQIFIKIFFKTVKIVLKL